jgi:class 3 adenylate cyclase
LIDPIIAAHNGRVVKRTGDGAIVEFRTLSAHPEERAERRQVTVMFSHSMRPVRPNSSDVTKNAKSCCDAGPEQRAAKAKLSCCPVRQALASLG